MKYFVILALLGFYLVNCTDESLTSSSTLQDISINDLPTAISDYVDSNYPDATISSAAVLSHATAAYIVRLNTNEILAFNGTGKFLGDGTGYCHNADSTMIEHDHGFPHGPEHGPHGEGMHGHGISYDSIPEAIRSYLATNFPLDTVLHAEIDSICPEGLVTKVLIAGSETDVIKLYFNENNEYLMAGRRVSLDVIPTAVTDTIDAAYPGYDYRHRVIELTLADGTTEYFVFLDTGHHAQRTSIVVRVDSSGTVICTNQ